MEQLITSVAAKAGISADQAKSAVETVVAFLKTKLPDSMSGQIDGLLSGGGGEGGNPLDNLPGGLGGMFGK